MNRNTDTVRKKVSPALFLVTIGIVYGDIGTSPMYVMKSILEGNGGITGIDESFIIGSLSLVIWTITLLTTIKYVLIAMKADNHGEGGIFSLYSLVREQGKWLIFPAMLGGAALLADGVLTPAVTVTTAVEGLRSMESMDRFLVGTTRNQIEGVNHIVSRFLTEMDRSMGCQLSSLAQSMSTLEQNQRRAAQATGENLSAAEGIIRNAQSLQEITSRALDKFDTYMSQLNTIRERDENFERRTADLLNDMRKESKDMASLISGLTDKLKTLPADGEETDNGKLTEISTLLSGLNDNVKTVSETLTRLSKEA